MKTLKKISLRQLDKTELSKRQEGLLFGGGPQGDCRCGSCASSDGNPPPSTDENFDANRDYGYTISGNGVQPQCTCSSVSILSIVSGF